MNIEYGFAGCKPVLLWHLGRHGTRHGTGSEIDAILGLPKLKARIADFKTNGSECALLRGPRDRRTAYLRDEPARATTAYVRARHRTRLAYLPWLAAGDT